MRAGACLVFSFYSEQDTAVQDMVPSTFNMDLLTSVNPV